MLLIEPYSITDIFYIHDLMPCCGKPVKYFLGPRGGNSTNIQCACCGQKWNVCTIMHFIEKI